MHMDSELFFQILFKVVGGLGIFLLGMKNMSEGMQSVAGEKLRKLISSVTSNRLMACGVGTLITSIIQSSSVTTVITVGMVNAGLMTLRQAIGVIMGANIGTTMTAWILVLDVSKYGLPLLGAAAFFYLFSKRDKLRFTAAVFLGLGMVFFGLELMKDGFAPLSELEGFEVWLSRFEPTTYWGLMRTVLVGTVLTAIIQSSSATIGITMGLAFTGVISYPTAAALVLGENIGTTITALLASFGTSTNARRAAYAHCLFNVIGVLWITSIFHWYIDKVVWFVTAVQGGNAPDVAVYTNAGATYPYCGAAIAATHSGFNILNTFVFLPFVGVLDRFLRWIVPEHRVPQPARLTYLDVRMLETPAFGLEQAYKEILKMADTVDRMFSRLHEILAAGVIDANKAEEIFQQEVDLDEMQREIVEFIGHIMTGNISHEIIEESRRQLRMVDEYESISDYVTSILKLRLKLRDNDLAITPEGLEDLLKLHVKVDAYIKLIGQAMKEEREEFFTEAQAKGNSLTRFVKDCRNRHLARVSDGKASPLKSLIFTDMLTAYRRIKDHAFNIAEVLAGEK
jgi:phosphate:Na+ symporter